MKILLIFITRLFLTVLAFFLLLCGIGISLVLFVLEPNLFFYQIGESLLKLVGIVLCGFGAWYVGKPQLAWWKKFLNE